MGAASTVTVGRALADEGCHETVGESVINMAYIYAGLVAVDEALPQQAQTPFAYAGAARGETGFGNQRTDTLEIEDGAFEGAEFEGKRMDITVSWNPVGSGPSNMEVFVQRKNLTGEFETIGFAVGSFDAMAENEFTMTLVEGEEYVGIGPTQPVGGEPPTQRNQIIIDEGETYRYFVGGRQGICDFEIVNEFQAFDPDCVAANEEETDGEE
jgi:hypothetical protein